MNVDRLPVNNSSSTRRTTTPLANFSSGSCTLVHTSRPGPKVIAIHTKDHGVSRVPTIFAAFSATASNTG